MRYVPAAALLCLFAHPVLAAEPLPSRPLTFPSFVVREVEPVSFELIDFRADERRRPIANHEIEPHSFFAVKQHLGFAGGYDNGVVHGAIGLYITIAEWGRWNFGIPSPELGFGRYSEYDFRRKQSFMKNESAIFISLASVHYRVGYMRSMGVNCYINLEQIFDTRQNMGGSQVGVSFSRK
jgi:hypothetical protein